MQYFKVVEDDGFYWVIVRVKCEGEWNSVIFFLFVTFVVLTVDQFVERGDGQFELQKQDSQARFSKNWHISLDLLEKSESSLHRRRSQRN